MKPTLTMTVGSVALVVACGAETDLPSPEREALAAVGSSSPVYAGCFQDGEERILSSRLTQEGASVKSCVAAASAAGYQYAGLEYGGECWGGSSLSPAQELNDDECDMPCDAAPDDACGGAWTISVYKLSAGRPKPLEPEKPKPTTPAPKPTEPSTPEPTTPNHDHMSDGNTHLSADQFPEGDPGSGELRIGPSEQDVGVEADGIGDFRTVCSYSHMNYDDPIVFPGKAGASHLHTYFGNTLTNASTTAESLANTGNSTCRGGIANRSAYWVPALLDGSGRPVAPIQSNFYYKSGYNGIPASQIRPFKTGLRMLAGSAKFSPSSGGTQEHAYWVCEDYSAGRNHEASIPRLRRPRRRPHHHVPRLPAVLGWRAPRDHRRRPQGADACGVPARRPLSVRLGRDPAHRVQDRVRLAGRQQTRFSPGFGHVQ